MAEFLPIECGSFVVKLADTEEELKKLYKLRYEELFKYYNKNNTNELSIDEYDHV